MATVKEVKLMDGEEQVTPYTLIDSVWYPNGTQFKENVYTKDQVYTKSEINDRRLKTYTLPETINGNYQLFLDPLEVGDMAYVDCGNYTVNANSSYRIHDGGGYEGRQYLVYIYEGNFPDSLIDRWSIVTPTYAAPYIHAVIKNLDYTYKTFGKIFIIRIL